MSSVCVLMSFSLRIASALVGLTHNTALRVKSFPIDSYLVLKRNHIRSNYDAITKFPQGWEVLISSLFHPLALAVTRCKF